MTRNAKSRLGCGILIVLTWASPLFGQAENGCSVCKDDKSMLRITPAMLRAFIKEQSFPELKHDGSLPDALLALDLLIDGQGAACEVTASDWPGPAEIRDALVRKVRLWKFAPASIKGQPACIKSRLLISAKVEEGRVRFALADTAGK